jgi:hypothetical protein
VAIRSRRADAGLGVSLKDVILRSANHFKRLYDWLLRIEESFANPPLPLSSALDALAGTGDSGGATSSASDLTGLASLLAKPPPPTTRSISELAMDVLTMIEESSEEIVLKRTAARGRHFKEYLQVRGVDLKLNDPRITHELRTLREALDDDLNEQRVFFPSLQKFDFVSEMGKRFNFHAIYHNLPDAHYELVQAQYCYVADNDAACVYHSLNAAEYALRALAIRRKVSKRQRDSWGEMISSLRQKMEGPPGKPQLGLQKKKRTVRRNALLDYYSQVLDQCVFFNEHWRKKVAHMPPRYTSAEALNALTRSGEFVKLLAEHGLKSPRQLPG